MASNMRSASMPAPLDIDPAPNAVGRRALVPDAGCVVHLDADAAPHLLWYGEDLLDVKMPAGTRVVYPKPSIPGLRDREGAVRYALAHPEQMEPLAALLRPGMRVTIGMDDISLPLPKMPRPDILESVWTILLELLAEKGVDDGHIIVATSFHRRMTAQEIERAVGSRVFRAYYPERLYNHDGEAPGGMVELGVTDRGERVRLNRRAAESDLLIYVNINLVSMDGGHKSVGGGLCGYESLKAHHKPKSIVESRSFMDPENSALAHSVTRIGKVCEEHLKIFHIETVLNNRMFDGPMSFLMKNE